MDAARNAASGHSSIVALLLNHGSDGQRQAGIRRALTLSTSQTSENHRACADLLRRAIGFQKKASAKISAAEAPARADAARDSFCAAEEKARRAAKKERLRAKRHGKQSPKRASALGPNAAPADALLGTRRTRHRRTRHRRTRHRRTRAPPDAPPSIDPVGKEANGEAFGETSRRGVPPPPVVVDAFLCPITFQYMRDPVITADGMTYERAAIEEWFGRRRSLQQPITSPLTGHELANDVLIENVALRGMIRDHQCF